MRDSKIINTIKDHLNLIDSKKGHQNRINAIIDLYDYLITIPEFLKENNKFKMKVISKLNDFINEPILRDKNDNKINNLEFIFSKFEIYENYLRNLDNKIIIKI